MSTFTDKVCSAVATKSMEHIDMDALARKLAPLLEKQLIIDVKYHIENDFYVAEYLDNAKLAQMLLGALAKKPKRKKK